MIKIIFIILVTCLSGFSSAYSQDYKIISTTPLTTKPFIEGLAVDGDLVYISSGFTGFSYITAVNKYTGDLVYSHNLPKLYFGEGIAILGDKIYQLTYKSNVVLIYDKRLKKIGQFKLNFEGWGMTSDGRRLVMTNGTNKLYFLSPKTHKIEEVLNVEENGKPAQYKLNDIAFHEGIYYMNAFQKNIILMARKRGTAHIFKTLNFDVIAKKAKKGLPSECVMNGITINSNQNIILGGKCWSRLYSLQLLS
jgi:glutamine cyclotransferase